MRGIPLVSLIPSPIMRGFYVTKSENDVSSSKLVDSSIPFYTTIDTPIEQQTETTSISDTSTGETVTVTHGDQTESEFDVNDIINDKDIDIHKEEYSTPSSSVIFLKNSDNTENRSNHEKSDLVTIPVDRQTSKREKLISNFDHNAPLSNARVEVSTTPTRRRIALTVSKYNEASTPLWTGRRIVAKKRNRTTASPIKDAIRRTKSDSIYPATNTLRSTSPTTKSASTLTSRRRKLPTTSTIPLNVPDSTTSPEILNIHNNFINSNNTKIEDLENHATVKTAVTLTNSVIAATPLISKIVPTTNDPITANIPILSSNRTTTTVPAIANTPITTPSMITVSKAPIAATDATINTSVTINAGIETTTLNYFVTDNPAIKNTNEILSDSAISTVASIETEITFENVNSVVSETTATDPAITIELANTEVESTFTTNYSTITIPVTANTQEIAIDSANITTVTNADIGATSRIVNNSTVAMPTTINTYEDKTGAVSITAASETAGVETSSTIGNYLTFTTAIKNITIPITTTASPLTTIISSSTMDMPTSNLSDANTVTENITTTTMPLNIIIPTITDFNVITPSAKASISSTSTTSEIPLTTIRSSSVTSSKVPITSTVLISTSSAAPTTLKTESSTIHLANPSNLDNNSEILTVTVTAESTQTTEIPTTFETPEIFISTATAFSKPFSNTNFETLVVTTALSTQENESSSTSIVTQTPSTPLSTATSITNKTTVVLERSTTSAMLSATSGESIAINPTIQTITNAYEPDFVRTISKESITPEQKTDFKEVMKTQIRNKNRTSINKPSSAQTVSDSTTPEIKIVSEEAISRATESRKHNQTTSDTINYQSSQKRRRVLNRTNNWLGSPLTLQRTNQYPQHRATLYRGRTRRPSTFTSSSKTIEKNHRRTNQKRIRVNSEAFNSTARLDQNTDVQNTTEDHLDRVENVRRMKVVSKKIKERVEKEPTTTLPIIETTLVQTTAVENKTLQIHHENGNIEEKQKDVLKKIKQSQEGYTMKESTNSSSTNTTESLPNNSQSNLYVPEDSSKLKNPRKIMNVILKDIRSKSEEKNPIEETSVDSDSINTNLQSNFSKSPYTDKNLFDKRIVGKRMRVVLKSVKPKPEEKNSTSEETNADPDSTDKNHQNNVSNNFNISQNFSNGKEPRRRMRIVLKRAKSKSEEEGTTSEEVSTEYNSNESLQGTFSNNFYSARNFPFEYENKRKMRVVLKSIKPKSEEKNSTVEEIPVDSTSTNKSLQDTFSNNFQSGKNLSIEHGTRRRMRVVLKSVKPKLVEGNSTVEKTSVDLDSINQSLQNTFSNHFHRGKVVPVAHGSKRRMRVVLKSVKPKSEERNSTVKETNVDSETTNKDLVDSFSNNFYTNKNLSDEEEARRGMQVVLKSVKPQSKEIDSVAEETNADSNFARKDIQVLHAFKFLHFSNNLNVSDNLPDKEKTMKYSKSEEEETMTKRPEDMVPQITRTSVPVEEDTDQPSLEVTNSGSVSHNPVNGYSNRHRKPTPFTTTAPLTNTLSNTLIVRRGRPPTESTLSPRIDFVDSFESNEYIKPTVVLHDQNADVSDQSIRAQEFAVTLSDPPSSSSDIGRTPLRDADRRKISTTVAPRTDPTTSRTVSRYDTNFRSRQRTRPKDRPTVNATTRPRRPLVIDYDYYEDEVPIIVGKSVINSKLFLTSKGIIRCLDQGNFPHPYSCKKFITCARMVNGQVIGTEYTCPDKLSFDPVGGICNWSAGLGCKD